MPTTADIKVPDIGEFTDVPVVEICVAVGDSVNDGDTLIIVESDKATIDIPASAAGIVKEIKVVENDLVSEGHVILSMEPEEAVLELESAAVESTENKPKPSSVVSDKLLPASDHSTPPMPIEALSTENNPGQFQATTTSKGVYASPSVRRFARELGIEIAQVTGTGPKNRVSKENVKVFVKQRMNSSPAGSVQRPLTAALSAIPAWPTVDYEEYGPVDRIPLSRITKISGPSLARNALLIPHVTNFDKSDVTELESFRQTLNSEAGTDDAKITMLTFAIKAAVSALKAYPKFNSSLDGDELVHKKYWNIGIAVNTNEGLVVPVVKAADQKGVREIANEIASLALAARDGKLSPADMRGSTFTISSLGGIGGTNFTPIINAPEVAILGMAKSEVQPVWDGQNFLPRLIQPLSLSFDHRVVDGVAAAYFLSHLGKSLNDFRRTVV